MEVRLFPGFASINHCGSEHHEAQDWVYLYNTYSVLPTPGMVPGWRSLNTAPNIVCLKYMFYYSLHYFLIFIFKTSIKMAQYQRTYLQEVYESEKSYFNRRNGLCFIVLSFCKILYTLPMLITKALILKKMQIKFRWLIYT